MTGIRYPLPKEVLEDRAKRFFGPFSQRDCSTCLFVPGGGKRTLVNFFLHEKSMMASAIGKSFDKTIVVYVNPDELSDVSNEAYLSLILRSLESKVNKSTASSREKHHASTLERIISVLRHVTYHGFTVVLILNDFEITQSLSPSIYRNLEAIMTVNKSAIAYMFCAGANVLAQEYLEKYHNLKYALTQHVSYHTLLDEKEFSYVIKQLCYQMGLQLAPSQGAVLWELSGGHPQLLKYALGILSETPKNEWPSEKDLQNHLLTNRQLHVVCNDVWEHLIQNERNILINIVKNNSIPKDLQSESEYLVNTRLIHKRPDGSWEVFGRLCKEFLLSQIPPEKLVYDLATNQIFFGMRNCTNSFTLQEFKLLSHFLQTPGKVVTRDDVGQVLWGKQYFEKYSDWMIDKIASTIRKKLMQIGFPAEKLVTLKKRGFYLEE